MLSYFYISLFQIHPGLVLLLSCIPEKVDINQTDINKKIIFPSEIMG
jgi:hypothetical protein